MFPRILMTGFLCVVAIVSGACGSGRSSPSAGAKPEVSPASSPGAEAPSSATSKTTSAAPVELIQSGITDDKANVSYRIKVNSDKPIDEVHLALKEIDAQGKVIGSNSIVWQNIVGSTRKPIESGKTYEDQTALDPGTAKAAISLKEVIFKDGSSWSAK
jgi:hypothetical protein